jgi:hypothetical protein
MCVEAVRVKGPRESSSRCPGPTACTRIVPCISFSYIKEASENAVG